MDIIGWVESEITKCKANGEEMFLGVPDKWFEPMRHGCENGHVSQRYLKSEALGDNVCLACFKPVYMIPNHINKDEELQEILLEWGELCQSMNLG